MTALPYVFRLEHHEPMVRRSWLRIWQTVSLNGEGPDLSSFEEINNQNRCGNSFRPAHLVAVKGSYIPAALRTNVEVGFPTNEEERRRDGAEEVSKAPRNYGREHVKQAPMKLAE